MYSQRAHQGQHDGCEKRASSSGFVLDNHAISGLLSSKMDDHDGNELVGMLENMVNHIERHVTVRMRKCMTLRMQLVTLTLGVSSNIEMWCDCLQRTIPQL